MNHYLGLGDVKRFYCQKYNILYHVVCQNLLLIWKYENDMQHSHYVIICKEKGELIDNTRIWEYGSILLEIWNEM